MPSRTIKIPRTRDKKIFETFKNIGDMYHVQIAQVITLALGSIGSINLNEDPSNDLEKLLEYDSCLIDSMSMSVGDLTIRYVRGGDFTQENKSAIFDAVVLTSNDQKPQIKSLTNVEKIDIVAFINKSLNPFESTRVIGTVLSEEQQQLEAIHQSVLERLEGLSEELIRKNSDFRKELEDAYNEKVQKAETILDEKEKLIDSNEKEKNELYERKLQELNEKEKCFDDRDNTHARRDIRDQMLEDVKSRVEKFGVSDSTARKRRPVFFGILVMFIIFLGMLAWTGYEIREIDKQYYSMLESIRNISSLGLEKLKGMNVDAETIAKISAVDVDRSYLIWLWARFAIFSFGFIGTILYYIKWQNKWSEQHIQSEFQLQQFYIDVNRANWVIESCLEWQKETKSGLPRELLQSIASGLFVNNQSELERVIHPADELASALLGTASNLKLKVGDNEICFDKPKNISNKAIKVVPTNEK